jgi:hypothetical protein
MAKHMTSWRIKAILWALSGLTRNRIWTEWFGHGICYHQWTPSGLTQTMTTETSVHHEPDFTATISVKTHPNHKTNPNIQQVKGNWSDQMSDICYHHWHDYGIRTEHHSVKTNPNQIMKAILWALTQIFNMAALASSWSHQRGDPSNIMSRTHKIWV